jgi:predicted membrane protein
MEADSEKKLERSRTRKYILGIIIIVAGLLLLASNTGYLPYGLRHIFFSWQMILIVIGLILLVRRESIVPGVILLLIGGIFILPRLFYFSFSMVHLFWPALLIAIGLLIIFKKFPRHSRMEGKAETQLNEGFLYEENIFSGSKQKIINTQFKGGRISCIFGGTEIDLSQSTLAPGMHELHISVVFGGATLIVPADWRIIIKNSSVLGGFTDKRQIIRESPDPSTMLVIKANAVFGGGELKSY